MISLLRSIAAVLAGYVIFAVPGFAVFQLSGQKAHAAASYGFMLLATVCGVAFAMAGGYAAGWLAGRRPVSHGLAVALLIALGATVSLIATLGHGAIWSQVTALVFMAPAAAIGGWLGAPRA